MAFELKKVTEGELNTEPPSITHKYRAEGTPTSLPGGDFFNYVASLALSQIPPVIIHPSAGTLYRQNIQVHESFYAAQYLITVPYGPHEKPESGAYQITVDQTGGTVHVTAGTRISGWGPSGGGTHGGTEPASDEKRDNGGLIGVDGDEVHGVDIPVEETKITVMFRHPEGALNGAYIRAIGKLVGFPNNDTFLGYDAGEVLYMGGNFTESNAEATAQYNFAISYNQTSFTVGGITVGEKKGWDVLAPIYGRNPANSKPERKLQYIEIIRPAGRDWKDYKPVFGWG